MEKTDSETSVSDVYVRTKGNEEEKVRLKVGRGEVINKSDAEQIIYTLSPCSLFNSESNRLNRSFCLYIFVPERFIGYNYIINLHSSLFYFLLGCVDV